MGIETLLRQETQRSAECLAFTFRDSERSYGNFELRARALAHGLAEAGVRQGDGVGVWLANGAEFFETVYATWKLGAYVVPMQARLHPNEVAHQCTDSEISALVASVKSIADLGAHAQHVLDGRQVIGVGDDVGLAIKSYERIIADNLGADVPQEYWPDAHLAWLFYTSGTTGRPKGACWTHGSILTCRSQYLIETYNFTRSDRYLLWGPATHGAGVFAWSALSRGATVVIPETHVGDRPVSLADVIDHHEITVLFATPTMIKKVADELEPAGRVLPTLRHVFYGGSAIPVEHLREAVNCMGQVFTQGYAQAECGGSISALSAEDHRDALESPLHAHRLESAGRPREGTRIRIVDEAGNAVTDGSVGEIAVSSPSVARGYWRQPRATRATFKNSWVMTGDLGRVDDDGYLYIAGRKRDVILSGGMNVYPAEIEQALTQHPDVSECAVIGLPHEIYGEAVCAVVVKRAGSMPTAEELTAFVLGRLANYKKPRSVVFADELPKNENGKVLKSALKEQHSPSGK